MNLFSFQAIVHEARCLEVYTRRVGVPGSAAPPPTSSTSAALLAWGALADQRWKELLAVVEAEDEAQASTATDDPSLNTFSKGKQKDSASDNLKKGSSSSSSGHNAGVVASAIDGSGATASKKIKKRRPLLIFFPFHNVPVLLGAYRSLILADRSVSVIVQY